MVRAAFEKLPLHGGVNGDLSIHLTKIVQHVLAEIDAFHGIELSHELFLVGGDGCIEQLSWMAAAICTMMCAERSKGDGEGNEA